MAFATFRGVLIRQNEAPNETLQFHGNEVAILLSSCGMLCLPWENDIPIMRKEVYNEVETDKVCASAFKQRPY